MIAIVVAVDKNRVIGEGNRIPWRVRSDLVRLAALTRGHPVMLGRKTYDSMVWYYNKSGRQMPGSHYIVLTRNANYVPERDDALIMQSIPEALQAARQFGDDTIFVIGGGSVFTEMLPDTDRIYLTEVQTEVQHADAYFPKLDEAQWREISHEHFFKNEKDEFDTEVRVLERR